MEACAIGCMLGKAPSLTRSIRSTAALYCSAWDMTPFARLPLCTGPLSPQFHVLHTHSISVIMHDIALCRSLEGDLVVCELLPRDTWTARDRNALAVPKPAGLVTPSPILPFSDGEETMHATSPHVDARYELIERELTHTRTLFWWFCP